jgi:predicted anti-sigma-YlaC factor YlaD
MIFKIDWSQPSTIRGAIWVLGSFIALLFLISSIEKAMSVMTITGMVAGGVGVAIKDNPNP